MDPLHLSSLHKLRQEGVLTDVVFVVEDVEFAAHKAVLAACSPVFCAMFSTNMEESNSNTVNIKDTAKDAFSDFLDYIYTKDPSYLMRHTQQMLHLADKYDLEFLAKACDDIIEKCLTEGNAVDYLLAADLYKRSELKVKICLFIKTRKRGVSACDSWGKLESNLELFDEMMQTILDEDQSSHSNVTWRVMHSGQRDKFTASVFENGKVYIFVVERYKYDAEETLDEKHHNIKRRHVCHALEISSGASGLFDNESLPITIKLSCRYNGAIVRESTICCTWDRNSTTKLFRLWDEEKYPSILLPYSQKYTTYPFDLTLSLEKTRPSSSPMKYFRGISADAKLTIGNSDILVHKSLLAERSQFFADLFAEELPHKKYPIEGVSMKTLDTLVGYMYCPDQFPKKQSVNLDLLKGASKFKLENLVNYCVEVLKGRITVKNVVEVYTTAKELSLDQLVACVHEFITENASNIVKTGNLKDFKDYPNLLKKIFFESDNNHSSDQERGFTNSVRSAPSFSPVPQFSSVPQANFHRI